MESLQVLRIVDDIAGCLEAGARSIARTSAIIISTAVSGVWFGKRHFDVLPGLQPRRYFGWIRLGRRGRGSIESVELKRSKICLDRVQESKLTGALIVLGRGRCGTWVASVVWSGLRGWRAV
jgi:hypothetical protein